MQILQVKTRQDFNQANPGLNTVLVWSEIVSGTGRVILHSKTSTGAVYQVGTGFGQQVELCSDVTTPPIGVVIPFLRNNNGNIELVLKTSDGDIIPIGIQSDDIIPAICVGVDETNGTCTAVGIDLELRQDGTVDAQYSGKKYFNLVYEWATLTQTEIEVYVSGYGVQQVNGYYTLENVYVSGYDRVWVNNVTPKYVLKYDDQDNCWKLYDIQQGVVISYQTIDQMANPYGNSWTQNITVNFYGIDVQNGSGSQDSSDYESSDNGSSGQGGDGGDDGSGGQYGGGGSDDNGGNSGDNSGDAGGQGGESGNGSGGGSGSGSGGSGSGGSGSGGSGGSGGSSSISSYQQPNVVVGPGGSSLQITRLLGYHYTSDTYHPIGIWFGDAYQEYDQSRDYSQQDDEWIAYYGSPPSKRNYDYVLSAGCEYDISNHYITGKSGAEGFPDLTGYYVPNVSNSTTDVYIGGETFYRVGTPQSTDTSSLAGAGNIFVFYTQRDQEENGN